MKRRCLWLSRAAAGFTLLELLVSLAAGSLLLVVIGFAIQRLSQDWQPADGSTEVTKLSAEAETTRQLLVQILPQLGEDGLVLFDGSASSLTAYVQPLQAVSALGLLKMTLSRRVTADGVAVSLKFAPSPGAATNMTVPSVVFDERLVLQGLKDFRLIYVAPGLSATEATPYWSPSTTLPAAIILTLEPASGQQIIRIVARPQASIDGRCLFDAISGDCRL